MIVTLAAQRLELASQEGVQVAMMWGDVIGNLCRNDLVLCQVHLAKRLLAELMGALSAPVGAAIEVSRQAALGISVDLLIRIVVSVLDLSQARHEFRDAVSIV